MQIVCYRRTCPKEIKHFANNVQCVSCNRVIDNKNYPHHHISSFGCLTIEHRCLGVLAGSGLVFALLDLDSQDGRHDAFSAVNSLVAAGLVPIVPYNIGNVEKDALNILRQAGACTLPDNDHYTDTVTVIKAISGVVSSSWLNIKFDDLCDIFTSGSNVLTLNCRATGKKRSENIAKQIISGLYSQFEGVFIDRILVSFSCVDLEADEFSTIMNVIERSVGDDATIMSGIASDGTEEHLFVTVVAGG